MWDDLAIKIATRGPLVYDASSDITKTVKDRLARGVSSGVPPVAPSAVPPVKPPGGVPPVPPLPLPVPPPLPVPGFPPPAMGGNAPPPK